MMDSIYIVVVRCSAHLVKPIASYNFIPLSKVGQNFIARKKDFVSSFLRLTIVALRLTCTAFEWKMLMYSLNKINAFLCVRSIVGRLINVRFF